MPPSTETWIAFALVALAAGVGVGAAATSFAPLDHLEERCAPPLPPGEHVELDVREELRTIDGLPSRVIVFTPAVSDARLVLRPCASQDAEIVRVEQAPAVRVVLSARGYTPHWLEEDAEVKLRAVLVEGALYLVPRIELHGASTLPHARLELLAPAQADASLEAWP